MKPQHTAEQSTVRVNKAEAMGRKGFAAIASLKAEAVVVKEEKVVVEVAVPVAMPTVTSVEKVSAPVPTQRAFAMVGKPADEKPKLRVHMPENPQDALICDSCQ